MQLKELLNWGIEELKKSNNQTPRLDAEVLLSHSLKIGRLQLYVESQEIADSEREACYRNLISKRGEFMPVSYLTGYKEFMSLDFIVNENVLIPRPETEILVETICTYYKSKSRMLDLGTGSGAIAISLAKYKPDCRIIATDISLKALLVAQENARRHNISEKIHFIQGDLFSPFQVPGRFDWVVSNPPYIPAGHLEKLPLDIRNYEPLIALDGGLDGLDIIRRIILNAHKFLKPDGQMAIEIGYGQSHEVQKIADETKNYHDYSIINDYSGIPRVFYCRRKRVTSGKTRKRENGKTRQLS